MNTMAQQIKMNSGALILAAALITLTSFSQTSHSGEVEAEVTNNAAALKGISAANGQFYEALNAVFTGNVEPMKAIWSHGDDISYRGPFNDNLDGWTAIGKQFDDVAQMKIGGRVACMDMIVRAGQDLGYTVCVEQGNNESTDGKPVEVSQRATNIFRLEDGQWKLVHHHTDISPQLEQAFSVPK